MTRGAIIKILAAALAAVAVASYAASSCGTAATTAARATPITFDDDFAFEDFTTEVPASASPSPSPAASAAANGTSSGGRSSGTTRPRSSTQAASASGPVNCPSGVVTGEYEEFSASEGPEEDGVPTWTVRAQGSVLNQTARAVRDIQVVVTLHTDSAESQSDGVTITQWVGVGSSHAWTVQFDEYESENSPGKKDITFAVTGWSWGDEFAQCPTQGFSG